MRKVFTILITIVSILCVCTACGSTDIRQDSIPCENGITVIGDGEYTWKASSVYDKSLQIETDDLTISGTAECNMSIWLMSGVTELNIENLMQGDYKIDIWFPNNADCTLKFSGNNNIYSVGMCDNVEIIGNDQNDELMITGIISANEDLIINGGKLSVGFLSANGCIEIIEETQIMVKEMKHSSEVDTAYARICSGEDIFIDLEDNGFLHVYGDGFPLILSEETIKFGENTELKSDEYKVDYSTYYGCYAICNDSGKEPVDVIIKSLSSESK